MIDKNKTYQLYYNKNQIFFMRKKYTFQKALQKRYLFEQKNLINFAKNLNKNSKLLN